MAKAKTKLKHETTASKTSTKTKSLASHDDAARMLVAGDWNGGLAALVALWTQTRSADLATEIERLSAHALKSRPELQGEGAALQTSWEKTWATRNAVGLERLLSVIRDGTADHIRARLDRLRELPPDPRMMMVVTRFANELHLRSDQARPVWTAFFKLVSHTGDPRSRAALTKLAKLAQAVDKRLEKFEEYLVAQIETVVDKLPSAGKYDVVDLRRTIDRLVAKPVFESAREATDVDALYAQVLDDPSDDAARQVWADALLQAGNDRGTFVALQLEAERRALTSAEDKQMDKLLAANRLQWLGQAGAAIETKTATFRHGVLDSAELARKVKPADLDARELRTVTQLYARTPSLLRHPNFVALRRLGRAVVPNPHSTTGPFGYDYLGPSGEFDWDETCELATFGFTGITHLETSLPKDLDVTTVTRAFPDLATVLVGYSWSDRTAATFEPLIPWLSKMRDVFFKDIVYSKDADGWFVDRLPSCNVHFIFGGGALYRSYLRRDGGLHAVFTDTSTKGGFSDDGRRAGNNEWMQARTKFFKRMPVVDSLVFRPRSTWHAIDVDAVVKHTAKMKNVTLPKAKKV